GALHPAAPDARHHRQLQPLRHLRPAGGPPRTAGRELCRRRIRRPAGLAGRGRFQPTGGSTRMTQTSFRIGQIVPSSNTTMETEIPAMLLARQGVRPERFTFHSSRMRMKKVVKEELEAMDR